MTQMRNFIIALFILGMTSVATAQDKIAHINVSELLKNMPEMTAAKTQLEKLSKTYDSDYRTMVEEFQAKVKKYEAEVETVSEKMNEERSKEVQDMQNRIVQFRDNAGKELQQKESELVKPILEKAKVAIQKVAKAKGFKYVLDATEGGTVIVADGTNIYNEVKTELGF